MAIPSAAADNGAHDTFGARMRALYDAVFVNYWPYWAACLAAALLNIMLLAYWGSAWGVTAELTRWGGHVLQLVGVPAETWPYFQEIGLDGTPFTRTAGVLTVGMLGGALVGALLSGNFRIRMPAQRRRLVQGFVGGVVAGFGARLAMGCNLGSFFSAIPQFSLHGWLFMLGLFPGTYVGTRLALHPLVMGRGRPGRSGRSARRAVPEAGRSLQTPLGVAVALLIAGAALYATVGLGEAALGIVLLFGVGFGFLVQRGRICFTSAFREMWITRQGDLGRALALAMMVSTLGIAALVYNGIGGNVQVAGPGALVGGILFGIGIVLAGGCESGWMYRSMEGYVQLWMAGIGTVAGATLLAWAWDGWHVYDLFVAGWPAVSLVDSWGWSGAIFGTLGLMAAWYVVITWWETRRLEPVDVPAGAVEPSRRAVAAPQASAAR